MASASASVEDLVRLLMERTGNTPPGELQPDTGAEEIVLDVLIDGSCWSVCRNPSKCRPGLAHASRKLSGWWLWAIPTKSSATF